MKKLILFIVLILGFNENLGESYFATFIKSLHVGVQKNIYKAILYITEIRLLKKIFSYIDITDKSLGSDQIVLIRNNEDIFYVKFINLYNLKTLKNYDVNSKKEYVISNDLYEKIKRLSLPLNLVYDADCCKINTVDETFILKMSIKYNEVLIISNNNFIEIINELEYIDYEN